MISNTETDDYIDDIINDDRPRWEYHHITSELGDSYPTFIVKLNTLGFNGWEVINIVEIKDNDVMNPSRCFWNAWLKRKYRFERNCILEERAYYV